MNNETKCTHCDKQLTIVGVAQIAEYTGVPPARMSDMVNQRGFPEPAGNLGKRRDFWILEDIRAHLDTIKKERKQRHEN